MIGDYIKDPSCGLGKVIKLRPGNELVYFFKANDSLHDGGGKGPDCHYWLCFKGSLTLVHSVSLCKLIERRQQWK